MKTFLTIPILLFIFGCREPQGLPKPRAYPRVEYPEHAYTTYDTTGCPFTFNYPSYGTISPKKEKCWFDIYMPAFNARLHCSYLPVHNREEFDDLILDAFEIAKRINDRANYMEESRIEMENGIGGLMLEWSGPAASPVHFFLTDTTTHFFKAALYYDARVQPDSLAPITAFIKEDIRQMITTFNWKE